MNTRNMDISIKFDLEKDLPRNSEDKLAKVMISTMLLTEVAPDLDPTFSTFPSQRSRETDSLRR